jgi:hypothetical protein
LVGLHTGLRLGSFFELLIDSSNRIKWFSRAWFTNNASPKLAERKIVKGTKNFGFAFIPFLFIASIDAHKYFKMQSVLLV